MKRNEEAAIIIDSLSRADLINQDKLNEARTIVKGALAEIQCKKYEEEQAKNPKEVIEGILSESKIREQMPGKNPFEFVASINGKKLFDTAVGQESRPDIEKRVSALEKRIDIIRDCVNEGRKIDLFWKEVD